MNISAALSIQTNCIGGSAKGNFIDSDKFKSSDLNYLVQVKVVNQRIDRRQLSRLNVVQSVLKPGDNTLLDETKFLEVYGVMLPAFYRFQPLTATGHFHIGLGRRWRVKCPHFSQVDQ
jgi:hypothetical protein